MAHKRARHTLWSDVQEVHPDWIEQYGGITKVKELIVYTAKTEGYQVRFLKAPEKRIRFQIRERL